jgi:hypothetical protein
MIEERERLALVERLQESRQHLLAALDGVTERDFSTRLAGDAPEPERDTVVRLLARLAFSERSEVAEALGRPIDGRAPEKPLPPQVMHDLAGARYRTYRYLEHDDATFAGASALVERIEEREREAARRIRERPPLDPPISIPVIQP